MNLLVWKKSGVFDSNADRIFRCTFDALSSMGRNTRVKIDFDKKFWTFRVCWEQRVSPYYMAAQDHTLDLGDLTRRIFGDKSLKGATNSPLVKINRCHTWPILVLWKLYCSWGFYVMLLKKNRSERKRRFIASYLRFNYCLKFNHSFEKKYLNSKIISICLYRFSRRESQIFSWVGFGAFLIFRLCCGG